MFNTNDNKQNKLFSQDTNNTTNSLFKSSDNNNKENINNNQEKNNEKENEKTKGISLFNNNTNISTFNTNSFFGKKEETKEEIKLNNNLEKKETIEEEYSDLIFQGNSKILNKVKNNVMKNLNFSRKVTDGDYHKLFETSRKDIINRQFNLTKKKKKLLNINSSISSLKSNNKNLNQLKNRNNTFVKINFMISCNDFPEIHQKEFYLKFKSQIHTKDVLDFIKNNIKENFNFDIDKNNMDFFLMKNENVLNLEEIFMESGLEDEDYIYIVLANKDDLSNNSNTKTNYDKIEKEREELNNLSLNDINKNSPVKAEKELKNNLNEEEDLCPLEYLPKIDKSGYNISPSLAEIARLSVDEIKHIKNFCFYNQFGKILYEDDVSLYDVRLNDIFNIELGKISIYENDIVKPKIGEGFNKPAIITLYGVLPENNDNLDDYVKKIENLIHEFNGEFISYNYDEGGKLVYRISHL